MSHYQEIYDLIQNSWKKREEKRRAGGGGSWAPTLQEGDGKRQYTIVQLKMVNSNPKDYPQTIFHSD